MKSEKKLGTRVQIYKIYIFMILINSVFFKVKRYMYTISFRVCWFGLQRTRNKNK